jgi:hypothetical protein
LLFGHIGELLPFVGLFLRHSIVTKCLRRRLNRRLEALGNFGKTTVLRAGMSEAKAVDREAVRDEFLRLYPADTPHAKKEAFRRCVHRPSPRLICEFRIVA